MGAVPATRRLSVSWLACSALVACSQPSVAQKCPQGGVGDLVVSELRGPQEGSYRQWIEVYNASDAAIAVADLRFSFTRLDGTDTVEFVVRDEGLEVAPGDYLVFGGGSVEYNDYIDYDYTADFPRAIDPGQPRDLYGGALLDVLACDVLIDRVVYGLPEAGTLALDGASPPDASKNDKSEVGWCVDDRAGEDPSVGIGLPGSPGEANPPCPPAPP
jgi:hypothetical protein